MTIEEKLGRFVAQHSVPGAAGEVNAETRLFSSGLLDSLAFVELVFFIESELDCVLGRTTDVTMTTMDRVGDVLDLVRQTTGMR